MPVETHDKNRGGFMKGPARRVVMGIPWLSGTHTGSSAFPSAPAEPCGFGNGAQLPVLGMLCPTSLPVPGVPQHPPPPPTGTQRPVVLSLLPQQLPGRASHPPLPLLPSLPPPEQPSLTRL